MSNARPTQLPGDKVKKAIICLSELIEQYPDKTRKELLNQVEIKFDLSPLECEFLNKHFAGTSESK